MFLIMLINFAANCGSYLPTLEWMKNKKARANIQNDDNKCFQYSIINYLQRSDINASKSIKRRTVYQSK